MQEWLAAPDAAAVMKHSGEERNLIRFERKEDSKRSIDSFASRRASMRFQSVSRRLTTAFRRTACRRQIWRRAGSTSPARPAKRKFSCREPIDVADSYDFQLEIVLFQRIGADDRRHVVLGHALVVDHTAPVEAESEIVGVAVGVHKHSISRGTSSYWASTVSISRGCCMGSRAEGS